MALEKARRVASYALAGTLGAAAAYHGGLAVGMDPTSSTLWTAGAADMIPLGAVMGAAALDAGVAKAKAHIAKQNARHSALRNDQFDK